MSMLKKAQQSLVEWGKQKWRTKSGKKSSETGERYLPEKAIKSLSSKEYAATTAKKRADTAKGKQHSAQPKSVAKKVKRAPSAYNKYMKKKLAELKKKHPRSNHQVLFKRAAKSWKRSPERKRSLK